MDGTTTLKTYKTSEAMRRAQKVYYKKNKARWGRIFGILNTETEELYVGVTTNSVKKIWWQYKAAAKSGRNSKLFNAIRQYGVDSFQPFEIQVLGPFDDPEIVLQEYLDKWEPEYNVIVRNDDI